MKTKYLIIIIGIVILTISSCRKYEEGGSYFLTDMTEKIAGEYNFTHYYIDGVDSVNYYFNNEYVGILYLLYTKGYSDLPLGLSLRYNNEENKNNFGISGYDWGWSGKNKQKLKFSFGFPPNDTIFYTGPFKAHTESIWKVLKLKDNELILETDYNNKHYRLELYK